MATVTESERVEGDDEFFDRVRSDPANPADSVEVTENLNSAAAHSFLGVQMFDGGGSLVVASAGSFLVKVKTTNTQQFELLGAGGVIDATAPTTVDWSANTVAVQVVPTGLAGVTTWRVFITQNRT